MFKRLATGLPRLWSSGQRARFLLRRSDFESCWSLQFFCIIVVGIKLNLASRKPRHYSQVTFVKQRFNPNSVSPAASVANSLLSQELKLCFSDTKFTKAPEIKKDKRFFLDTRWDTKSYQNRLPILNLVSKILRWQHCDSTASFKFDWLNFSSLSTYKWQHSLLFGKILPSQDENQSYWNK